jgi:glyoxylase-like metal-dependent hydrolase (beta-lactamase superfamily II)
MPVDTDLPVAAEWFARRRIDDDVTLLWEPHVDPLVRCNIWHVRGRDHDLLVDSGLGIASLQAAAADLFEHPTTGVATHYHYDHTGGMPELAERLIHPLEAPLVARGAVWGSLTLDEMPDLKADLAAAGYPVGDLLVDALPHEGYDVAAYVLPAWEPTRMVAEGEVVDLGDRSFEVLHLPGHSPGSIGLWDEANAVLFSGDAIYDGPLLDQLGDSDVVAYLETMARLRALPVEVVHAGHEPSFGRARLVELCDAYLTSRG